MNYLEFVALAEPEYPDFPLTEKFWKMSNADKKEARKNWEQKNAEHACFKASWVSGGLEGGNCWGGEATYGVSTEPEPNFTALDDLLLKVCPGISFLMYRSIESKLIERGESSTNEYYGNYTEYRNKSISLRKLYDFLLENNLI